MTQDELIARLDNRLQTTYRRETEMMDYDATLRELDLVLSRIPKGEQASESTMMILDRLYAHLRKLLPSTQKK